jgi:hypothetical protein
VVQQHVLLFVALAGSAATGEASVVESVLLVAMEANMMRRQCCYPYRLRTYSPRQLDTGMDNADTMGHREVTTSHAGLCQD